MKKRTEEQINDFFARNRELEPIRSEILAMLDVTVGAFSKNKKLLVCGNGGSAADAEHIVGELVKSFVLKRPLSDADRKRLCAFGDDGALLADNLQAPIRALSLCSHNSLRSAIDNDIDAAYTFAQQALAYADEGDVLLCISTSGNAKNVRLAAVAAKARGARVVGFTGESGGALAKLCDVCVKAPAKETYLAQEYHIRIYHLLCMTAESEMFDL